MARDGLAMLVTDVAVKLTKRRPAVLTKESGDLVSNALGACEDQDLIALVVHDGLDAIYIAQNPGERHDIEGITRPYLPRLSYCGSSYLGDADDIQIR